MRVDLYGHLLKLPSTKHGPCLQGAWNRAKCHNEERRGAFWLYALAHHHIICWPHQADDWVMYSASARAELARVHCGGWRRQCACSVAGPDAFTFAWYRDRRLHIARRRLQQRADALAEGE